MSTKRSSLTLAAVTILTLGLAGCVADTTDTAPTASQVPEPSGSPTSTTTPDPWLGHYEQQASDEAPDFVTQFWGSFGDEGAVAGIRDENQTLAAGVYTVQVSCEGDAEVVASFEQSDGGQRYSPSRELQCPASAELAVQLDGDGLVSMLDSRGDVGAYLVQVNPAPPVEEMVDRCLADASLMGPGPGGQIERTEPIYADIQVALRPDGLWYLSIPLEDDEVEIIPEYQCRIDRDLSEVAFLGSRIYGEADDFDMWATATEPTEGM